MYHRYTAYGLTIASELECPELIAAESSDPVDIAITLAEIPERIDAPRHVTPRAQVGDGVFQFEAAGVARYRALGGRDILVHPFPGASPENVRLFLLGTLLGALLHQRGRLPLHASAVEWEGGAIAFCGHSGAGKSTLVAALHRRGLPVLCDDVGVVVPSAEGEALFYPGFPRIKLWRDALEHFEVDVETLAPDWNAAEKYHLQLHERFHHRPLPLRKVCFLERTDPDGESEVRLLQGAEGIPQLVANTYRPRLMQRLGDLPAHFRRCARIAESVTLCRFTRPWSLERLEGAIDLLLSGKPESATGFGGNERTVERPTRPSPNGGADATSVDLIGGIVEAPSPELQLLLRCLAASAEGAPDGEVERLLSGPLGVAKILWLAQRHRVAPRLYRALLRHAGSTPAALMEPLKRASRANAVRSLRQLESLKRIGAVCRDAGIEIASPTSSLLGIRLHRDPAWFHAGALNLLCPADQVERAARLIHAESGRESRVIGAGGEAIVFAMRAGAPVVPAHILPVEHWSGGAAEGASDPHTAAIATAHGVRFPDDAELFRFLGDKSLHNQWRSLAPLDQLAGLWARVPEVGARRIAERDESLLSATLLSRALLGTPLPREAALLVERHGRDRGERMVEAVRRLLLESDQPSGSGVELVTAPRDLGGGSVDLGEFVATPKEVAGHMLDLAEVGAEDVCCDLGCGDGRILIEAAVSRGCRGIGYDIDPALVERATAAAAEAGVGDRVRFVHQDVLRADLSAVTVVISYLRTRGNRAMLPRFREQLRPGARIVTRDFHFGAWVPLRVKVQTVNPANVSFLYLWRW